MSLFFYVLFSFLFQLHFQMKGNLPSKMSNCGDLRKTTIAQDNCLTHRLLFVGLWQGEAQTRAERTLTSASPHSRTSLHHLPLRHQEKKISCGSCLRSCLASVNKQGPAGEKFIRTRQCFQTTPNTCQENQTLYLKHNMGAGGSASFSSKTHKPWTGKSI